MDRWHHGVNAWPHMKRDLCEAPVERVIEEAEEPGHENGKRENRSDLGSH